MDLDEPRSTRDKKGWLIPYLIALDNMFYKRWDYWTRVCMTNRIPLDPIPYIHFQDPHAYPQQLVRKNIEKCLNMADNITKPLETFVDWILWGLNQGEVFPQISLELDDAWYRSFCLDDFFLEPAEHWSTFASDYLGKNNRLGFFATPSSVAEMMTRMTFGSEPQHHHKTMSVLEPTAGCGVLLLSASNYSLNLYGVDISPLLVKICRINAYIYIPWMVVRPKHLTVFDKKPIISEIEFPSGVKIPQCERCSSNNQSFYLDIETEHEAVVSTSGLITIETPKITTDLVNKKLKPENIRCTHCMKEELI